MLELAVAVELVTEEVREQERARLEPACHLGQGSLVDFEQSELGIATGEQGGGDAGHEVGTGRVVHDPNGRTQDLGDHRSGRRLAVRGGDQGGPSRQPPPQGVDRTGVEFPEQLPGERRATAPSRQARQRSSDAERGGFEVECERGAHRPTP